jgi:hypothetical protein
MGIINGMFVRRAGWLKIHLEQFHPHFVLGRRL